MPLVMFNPKLVNMLTTGYGVVGRDLRNLLAREFEAAVVLQTLPNGSVISCDLV